MNNLNVKDLCYIYDLNLIFQPLLFVWNQQKEVVEEITEKNIKAMFANLHNEDKEWVKET